ncbi:uncharacterized protein LOC129592903 [Paramacrobiotus metropolitanus]|uniref:uncharacterized protein LOC129592903 n=1 Tax=Paramacrobiotus metropolitanus TaxID=2943436 RepID=UPI002445F345|nr:uncharacterized protein LOC129592903 [Paramacrobiotus metropolitanus]
MEAQINFAITLLFFGVTAGSAVKLTSPLRPAVGVVSEKISAVNGSSSRRTTDTIEMPVGGGTALGYLEDLDLGYTASHELKAVCSGSSVALTLIGTDSDRHLQSSSLVVGDGGAGCQAAAEYYSLWFVEFDLVVRGCGRTHDAARKVYKWQVTVLHYPLPKDGIAVAPIPTVYIVACEAKSSIDINLEDHGVTATSQLDAFCNGKNVELSLIVADPGNELKKLVLVVGRTGEASCSADTGNTNMVILNTADTANGCGRSAALGSGDKITYTWSVTVNHFLEPWGTAANPISTMHTATCDVLIGVPTAVTDNPQPLPVIGEDLAGSSPPIALKLVREPSSTSRIWTLTLSPVETNALPADLSYMIETCTATPTGAATPIFHFIRDGCIIPKSGVKGTYDIAKKEYKLTVRAFGFAGQSGTVSIQCAAALCEVLDSGTGLCMRQGVTLLECVPR